MSQWQPLSVRRGLRPAVALAEGVPPHLNSLLEYWIEGICGYRSKSGMQEQTMLSIAVLAGVGVRRSYEKTDLMRQIIAAGFSDENVMLDILDSALEVLRSQYSASALSSILEQGGSAWTVRADNRGLERRVDPTTMSAYATATASMDAASGELQEAWSKAYGRNPDASDAWDHAIKAVESVLVPIVTPNNPKATLGNVLGDLKAVPTKLSFKLATSSQAITNIDTIEGMLRLIWPNPDRHGGASGATRKPDLDEAQAALQIAITIVQFVRAGVLS